MNLGRLNRAGEAEVKAPIEQSLDIWHVAKNFAKKIAKVVLFVMCCTFLLCLRCFVRSDLDNNKFTQNKRISQLSTIVTRFLICRATLCHAITLY